MSSLSTVKEMCIRDRFYQELVNSCCGANLLTYIGKVSLTELYEAGLDVYKRQECIRMSYATSDENIVEAIRRIKEALAKLK